MAARSRTDVPGAEVKSVAIGDYIAMPFSDQLHWGRGRLTRPKGSGLPDELKLLKFIIGSLRPVTSQQANTSICTEGLRPHSLRNGQPVPVRPWLPGASLGHAHFIYDALGLLPWKGERSLRPEDTPQWVAEKLRRLGTVPCAHTSCIPCSNVLGLKKNVVEFGRNSAFVQRVARAASGAYTSQTFNGLMARQRTHLRDYTDRYAALDGDRFVQAALSYGGEGAMVNYAIARGGVAASHKEEMVVRIDVENVAVDGLILHRMAGRQVFAHNVDASRQLARTIAGEYGQAYYDQAMIASEMHAAALYGSVMHNAPTWTITRPT